jgi:hypothetical protein
MACRNICQKYKIPHIQKEGGLYDRGFKRCNAHCSTYLHWEGLWCPCCGMRLRTKPRTPTKHAKENRPNISKPITAERPVLLMGEPETFLHGSKKLAWIFSTLNIPNVPEILDDLIDDGKNFAFFSAKYGRKNIPYTLKQAINMGLIRKVLDTTQFPLGYEITDLGRWVFHSYVNFQKELQRMEEIPLQQ